MNGRNNAKNTLNVSFTVGSLLPALLAVVQDIMTIPDRQNAKVVKELAKQERNRFHHEIVIR